MKNYLKLISICLIALVISACGGGGGENGPPAQTSGSISGTTVPGAIVGINCYLNYVPCANVSSTTIADSNGHYSFSGITQMGQYVVYASKPGYKSELAGTCGFSSGGFFGCGYNIPLLPLPPVTVTTGLDSLGLFGFIHDLYCDVASVCVIGAKTQIPGSLYQWGYGPSYLSMDYSSTRDILAISVSTSSGGVNRMDGVMCGVSSDVYAYGRWYYRCSDYFGITFNRVAGTISFDRTPLYHLNDGVTAYGASYPYVGGTVSGPSATGTLTFAPF